MKCTGVNRQWHDTRWRNPAEEHGQHVDHNDVSRFRTDVFLTPRHVTYTGSLGGTCWNSPHCGRMSSALVYGAQNTGLPPDHEPILLTLRYILQPQRGEAPTARAGIRWDLQAVADCVRKGDKRVEFLLAVDRSFEKAKPRFEALREDPTPDARWALWVDFVRNRSNVRQPPPHIQERRRTKRDRRHCAANWFPNKHSAQNRWDSFGRHTGSWATTLNNSCTHRHRLMSLNWQLRRWNRQSAAARQTSLEPDLQSAEAGKKPRGTQTDAAPCREWDFGTQTPLPSPSWFPSR